MTSNYCGDGGGGGGGGGRKILKKDKILFIKNILKSNQNGYILNDEEQETVINYYTDSEKERNMFKCTKCGKTNLDLDYTNLTIKCTQCGEDIIKEGATFINMNDITHVKVITRSDKFFTKCICFVDKYNIQYPISMHILVGRKSRNVHK